MYKLIEGDAILPNLIVQYGQYNKYPMVHETKLHSAQFQYVQAKENQGEVLEIEGFNCNAVPDFKIGYSASLFPSYPGGHRILSVAGSVDKAVLLANIYYLLEQKAKRTEEFMSYTKGLFYKVVDNSSKEVLWFKEEEDDIKCLADLEGIVGPNKTIYLCEGVGLEYNDALLVFRCNEDLLHYLKKTFV